MFDDDGLLGTFRPADRHTRRRPYRALARQIYNKRARSRPLTRGVPHGVALPSDEVEVGFPSVSTFVPGMRKVFFGAVDTDHDSMQQTEIALTARQATEGTHVPIDLTVRHTCPVCGGRGELWADPCGVCRGSGAGWVPHQLDLLVPPGVRDGSCLRFSVSPPYATETHIEVRIVVR